MGSHEPTRTAGDAFAWAIARFLASVADRLFARRYGHRAVVLETVAAVPGMVAAMLRHLKSLRSLTDDGDWIRILLDEAENERMHLMTFVAIARPNRWERWFILLAQAGFFGGYVILYIASRRVAHRMVGYLEEKAVESYTQYLAQLDLDGTGGQPAPAVAIAYWRLADTATLRDVITRIRDDECRHRDINHGLASRATPDSPHRPPPAAHQTRR